MQIFLCGKCPVLVIQHRPFTPRTMQMHFSFVQLPHFILRHEFPSHDIRAEGRCFLSPLCLIAGLLANRPLPKLLGYILMRRRLIASQIQQRVAVSDDAPPIPSRKAP
jgi:hypothetical protein